MFLNTKSFSSVVCYPQICIHGFKSTQRGERSDKKKKRLKAWRYYWKTSTGPTKKPHKKDFFADYSSFKASLCALYWLCFSDYSSKCACLCYSIKFEWWGGGAKHCSHEILRLKTFFITSNQSGSLSDADWSQRNLKESMNFNSLILFDGLTANGHLHMEIRV